MRAVNQMSELTPIPLDELRAKNAKTTGTTAHEIIMCPVFRLGFLDYRDGVFREDWEWARIIAGMGLSGSVLGKGSWSYERGQSFAQACPDIAPEAVGGVTKDSFSPIIQRLSTAMANKDVL